MASQVDYQSHKEHNQKKGRGAVQTRAVSNPASILSFFSKIKPPHIYVRARSLVRRSTARLEEVGHVDGPLGVRRGRGVHRRARVVEVPARAMHSLVKPANPASARFVRDRRSLPARAAMYKRAPRAATTSRRAPAGDIASHASEPGRAQPKQTARKAARPIPCAKRDARNSSSAPPPENERRKQGDDTSPLCQKTRRMELQ